MIVTVGLTIGFGKSDNLAASLRLPVRRTMFDDSVLLIHRMREIWRWRSPAGGRCRLFLIVDAAFFSAML